MHRPATTRLIPSRTRQPIIALTDPFSLPRESKVEPSAASQDSSGSTRFGARTTWKAGERKRGEKRGDTARAEEVGEVEGPKMLADRQEADVLRFRGKEEGLTRKCERRENVEAPAQ